MNTDTATKTKDEQGMPDYEGKTQGDPGYNRIGAETKRLQEETGFQYEYHTKSGVRPVLDTYGNPVPMFKGIPSTHSKAEERDRFVATLQRAARRQP